MRTYVIELAIVCTARATSVQLKLDQLRYLFVVEIVRHKEYVDLLPVRICVLTQKSKSNKLHHTKIK